MLHYHRFIIPKQNLTFNDYDFSVNSFLHSHVISIVQLNYI